MELLSPEAFRYWCKLKKIKFRSVEEEIESCNILEEYARSIVHNAIRNAIIESDMDDSESIEATHIYAIKHLSY